jgi:acetyl-CoA carboxylase biotin carboxyl carrier protein
VKYGDAGAFRQALEQRLKSWSGRGPGIHDCAAGFNEVIPVDQAISCRPVPDVEAHITGTVWKIECQIGQEIAEGDTLVILESMKMEMPVEAEDDGTVKEIVCAEGQSVSEGDTLVVLE